MLPILLLNRICLKKMEELKKIISSIHTLASEALVKAKNDVLLADKIREIIEAAAKAQMALRDKT